MAVEDDPAWERWSKAYDKLAIAKQRFADLPDGHPDKKAAWGAVQLVEPCPTSPLLPPATSAGRSPPRSRAELRRRWGAFPASDSAHRNTEDDLDYSR
jgi:hypothetical protein